MKNYSKLEKLPLNVKYSYMKYINNCARYVLSVTKSTNDLLNAYAALILLHNGAFEGESSLKEIDKKQSMNIVLGNHNELSEADFLCDLYKVMGIKNVCNLIGISAVYKENYYIGSNKRGSLPNEQPIAESKLGVLLGNNKGYFIIDPINSSSYMFKNTDNQFATMINGIGNFKPDYLESVNYNEQMNPLYVSSSVKASKNVELPFDIERVMNESYTRVRLNNEYTEEKEYMVAATNELIRVINKTYQPVKPLTLSKKLR